MASWHCQLCRKAEKNTRRSFTSFRMTIVVFNVDMKSDCPGYTPADFTLGMIWGYLCLSRDFVNARKCPGLKAQPRMPSFMGLKAPAPSVPLLPACPRSFESHTQKVKTQILRFAQDGSSSARRTLIFMPAGGPLGRVCSLRKDNAGGARFISRGPATPVGVLARSRTIVRPGLHFGDRREQTTNSGDRECGRSLFQLNTDRRLLLVAENLHGFGFTGRGFL